MSDGAAMVLVVIAMAACGYVALRVLGFALGKGLDAVGHVAEGVTQRARDVAEKAGHSMSALALRAQTTKLVKSALEVSDQQTGANELNLDADQSKKNEALAARIVDRAYTHIGDSFGSELPFPAVLAGYALLLVASQLSAPGMREKTRIAGEAVLSLLVSESDQRPSSFGRTDRWLLREIESLNSQLTTDSLADAFVNS